MSAEFRPVQSIRPPAVAGMFYPAGGHDLRAVVEYYLSHADTVEPPPKAVIAPHAGYIYSGPVAASAYAGWRDLGATVRRVVLLGPAHRVYLRGMALPRATAFATPLGEIEIDQAAARSIAQLPGIVIDDHPHRQEHSLEVQLPFLQVLFPDLKLIPLVVGDAGPEVISAVLEVLWNGPETRIVISSDLSHYHSYDQARSIDRATSAAICALALETIGPEQACGSTPLRGLLQFARQRQLHISELDLRNSGDTAGPRDQVVGYGAYAVN